MIEEVTITPLLAKLAWERETVESIRRGKQQLVDRLEASEEWLRLEKLRAAAMEEAAKITDTIRDLARASFEQDGVKQPHPMIQIKHFKDVSIGDIVLLRNYCLANLTAALTPDPKIVTKYVKDFGPIPGTVLMEEDRVQIAADLDQYLTMEDSDGRS